MKVAIVNDMPMAREVLRRIIAAAPGLEVAWLANDGAEAVAKCHQQPPDLVLMDLIMPVMDGVEATRQIMSGDPCPILVVTATVDGNASKVFEAMGNGALDVVATPTIGTDGQLHGGAELLSKISQLARLTTPRPSRASAAATLPAATMQLPFLVAIGASTGGPNAVVQILEQLPPTFSAPVVIVQHVDQRFALNMAEWLNSQSHIPVTIAEPGDSPRRGRAYLAASNDHLILDCNQCFAYCQEPLANPFRPSVDVFFSSLAANWPGDGAAVLLTGIGQDGAKGMLILRNRGNWRTFAQAEASCVVYGMPKAAVEIGAAEQIIAPDAIARQLLQLLNSQLPPQP